MSDAEDFFAVPRAMRVGALQLGRMTTGPMQNTISTICGSSSASARKGAWLFEGFWAKVKRLEQQNGLSARPALLKNEATRSECGGVLRLKGTDQVDSFLSL